MLFNCFIMAMHNFCEGISNGATDCALLPNETCSDSSSQGKETSSPWYVFLFVSVILPSYFALCLSADCLPSHLLSLSSSFCSFHFFLCCFSSSFFSFLVPTFRMYYFMSKAVSYFFICFFFPSALPPVPLISEL